MLLISLQRSGCLCIAAMSARVYVCTLLPQKAGDTFSNRKKVSCLLLSAITIITPPSIFHCRTTLFLRHYHTLAFYHYPHVKKAYLSLSLKDNKDYAGLSFLCAVATQVNVFTVSIMAFMLKLKWW